MTRKSTRSIIRSGRDSIHTQYGFQASDEYELLFRLSLPQEGSLNWYLEYFMQSKRDLSLRYPLASAQNSLNPVLKLCTARKLEQIATLSGFSASEITDGPRSLTPDQAYLFLKNDAFTLRENGVMVQIPKNLEINIKNSIGINMRLKNSLVTDQATGSQILAFDYTVSLGGIEISQAEFNEMSKSKAHLVRVKDKWIEINPEDVDKVMLLLSNATEIKTTKEVIALGISAAGEGINLEYLADEKRFESIIDAIGEKEKFSVLNEPVGFIGTLRPYQKIGLGWLDYLSRLGLGALLADDMGLGKTVQIIAQAIRLVSNGKIPILIICPTSVIGNWVDEFTSFAPSLKVLVHHGSERSGEKAFKEEVKNAQIIITSYALAWRDELKFERVKWAMIVLDEAQNIKNPFAKQTRMIKKLKAEIKVALSGTPIENRLSELWSIMEFLNPGYLPDWGEFKEKFANPIETDNDENKKHALRKAISPFLMRRVKTDKSIIADLPGKNEITEWCRLTPEQATLYSATVESSLEKIDSTDEQKRKIEIFAAITKLKQICNHPSNMLKDSNELGNRSGKVERLRELVSTMIENGESVLIFSQYTEMAALLYRNLNQEFGANAQFSYLHGGLGRTQRDKIVKEFQATGDRPRILILSLKAGGTGLNLTKATNVIHFDRWWNPAVENQATDRAHRIGQSKNVFVYKLTTKGTIEEWIEEIIRKKKGLADSIVGSGESILTKLDGSKLREMFQLRDFESDE